MCYALIFVASNIPDEAMCKMCCFVQMLINELRKNTFKPRKETISVLFFPNPFLEIDVYFSGPAPIPIISSRGGQQPILGANILLQ